MMDRIRSFWRKRNPVPAWKKLTGTLPRMKMQHDATKTDETSKIRQTMCQVCKIFDPTIRTLPCPNPPNLWTCRMLVAKAAIPTQHSCLAAECSSYCHWGQLFDRFRGHHLNKLVLPTPMKGNRDWFLKQLEYIVTYIILIHHLKQVWECQRTGHTVLFCSHNMPNPTRIPTKFSREAVNSSLTVLYGTFQGCPLRKQISYLLTLNFWGKCVCVGVWNIEITQHVSQIPWIFQVGCTQFAESVCTLHSLDQLPGRSTRHCWQRWHAT